jgi:muramoyltetrapeptide carboxypeptidase
MDVPRKIIKPNRLKKNSLIALIAPAGPVKQDQIDKAQNVLSGMGFRSCYNESILSQKGYLAGDDETRLKDLHQAFEQENIDAIICIRGGYGCSRIVDRIDYDLIKQNPKIFIGYSDITVLLNAIHQQTGLITFHGIVGTSAFTEYTKAVFSDILTSFENEFIIYPEDKNSFETILPGKAKGKLVGGNLSLVTTMIGTKYQPNFDKNIVFLEDIGEAPYRIDRMLTQLLLNGCLQKASGIILGEFTDCDINNKDITDKNSLSLKEVFNDRLGNLQIPIISGFSFGHVKNQAIFPVGIEAELDTSIAGMRLLECPVS